MSPPFARVIFPDGQTRMLRPGETIGRASTAAHVIADPMVSEFQAHVSVRRGRLHLVALRRPFSVRGEAVWDVPLEAGGEIELTAEHRLVVVEVDDRVGRWGVRWGEATAVLDSGAYSLVVRDGMSVVEGVAPDALAVIHSSGESWVIRVEGGDPEPIRVGVSVVLGGHAVTFSERVPTGETRDPPGLALRFEWRFGTDRCVVRDDVGEVVASFSGRPAELFAFLARASLAAGPRGDARCDWVAVCRKAFDGGPSRRSDEALLPFNARRRAFFDKTMQRLKAVVPRRPGLKVGKPDAGSVVCTDGRGNWWLEMAAGDSILEG